MNDELSTPAEPQNANPWAASVRIKSRTMSQAYGQRRHDFRVGQQPNYVDEGSLHLNRTLFKPRPLTEIRDEVVALRNRRGAQRALKSNAAIVTAGIITFGHEAAKLFNALTTDEQDAAYSDLAHALADRLDTRLEALVHHGDETTEHAHFELRGVTNAGHPVSKKLTRGAMSELQDLAAEIMQKYCPDIQRGNRKQDRLDAGADYPDTLNRSVRKLHADLPTEIATKEQKIRDLDAEIAKRQASIAKDQDRVAKLKQKEVLQTNEEKRLSKYRDRIAKKVDELNAFQARTTAEHEALRHRSEKLARAEKNNADKAEELAQKTARAEPVFAQAKQAKAKTESGIAAVEAIIEEMANDTIRETPDELVLENPTPIIAAPKSVQKRLTKLVHRYLDLQQAWDKRTVWLGDMVAKMKWWQARAELPAEIQEKGDELTKDWELSLDFPDPRPPWAK